MAFSSAMTMLKMRLGLVWFGLGFGFPFLHSHSLFLQTYTAAFVRENNLNVGKLFVRAYSKGELFLNEKPQTTR